MPNKLPMWGKLLLECGRQDSNLHGLPGSRSRVPGSSSSGSQGRRVCQFHHARIERGMCQSAATWRGMWEPAEGLDTHPQHPFLTTARAVLYLNWYFSPYRFHSFIKFLSGFPEPPPPGSRITIDGPRVVPEVNQEFVDRRSTPTYASQVGSVQNLSDVFGVRPFSSGIPDRSQERMRYFGLLDALLIGRRTHIYGRCRTAMPRLQFTGQRCRLSGRGHREFDSVVNNLNAHADACYQFFRRTQPSSHVGAGGWNNRSHNRCHVWSVSDGN